MYCRQSFSVSAKLLCNSLPQNIRLCESMGTFKCELKKTLHIKLYLEQFCKIVNY